MSAGSKRRPGSKAALVALLTAAIAGLAFWTLTGHAPPSPTNAGAASERAERPARAHAPKGRFEGEVVAVLDGDTIDVMHEGAAVRVRLSGVDCPEKRQPFGKKAKQRASELAFGRVVRVNSETLDRYGRAVGKVALPDGGSLNEILVRDGLAWWYRQYSKDPKLGVLEAEAKAARRGLWADPDPKPPWEFRRERRHSKKAGRREAAAVE